MTQITPQLPVDGITRLNALLTILIDCEEVCKNGNVRVRKGQAGLHSQVMLRLAKMVDSEFKPSQKSKTHT
jgi:hypothetical protein